MQVQLFVAPRSVASGEPGLVLGAALILAYFLLSTALVNDFRRSSPPPLAGGDHHPRALPVGGTPMGRGASPGPGRRPSSCQFAWATTEAGAWVSVMR